MFDVVLLILFSIIP